MVDVVSLGYKMCVDVVAGDQITLRIDGRIVAQTQRPVLKGAEERSPHAIGSRQ